MCNNCIHKAVCSIYRATGGVKKCEHHREERKGKWLWKPTNYWTYILTCSLCSRTENAAEDCKYCPNCGADMRGAEEKVTEAWNRRADDKDLFDAVSNIDWGAEE